MPGQLRRRWCSLLLLVVSLSVLLLAQCVVAAVPVPHHTAPAGICGKSCAPANTLTPAPVILPTTGPLLPFRQPHLRVVHAGYQHVLPRVEDGVSLVRAPPRVTP